MPTVVINRCQKVGWQFGALSSKKTADEVLEARELSEEWPFGTRIGGIRDSNLRFWLFLVFTRLGEVVFERQG
jgi:hypothetical protein